MGVLNYRNESTLVPYQESFGWAAFLSIKINIVTTLEAIDSTKTAQYAMTLLIYEADRGRHETNRGRHEAEPWNEDIRYMRFPKGPNSVSLG
ncbi:hypothetical protein T4B_7721 [Trichinella pseudospiralis]|uniref:Uncharacterized protein n=1 Tax=Trichinella pseudospiralis TaxID=6337 RepID=A0A0V1HCM6_TRIPS|nr:hypothetical protein T4B_7721 [Trichinella pseudospiralis]